MHWGMEPQTTPHRNQLQSAAAGGTQPSWQRILYRQKPAGDRDTVLADVTYDLHSLAGSGI
jgi:hypothetical protein